MSAVAVLVGSTIGSGIFRVPASVAGRITEPGPFLLAWAIGGAIVLCGALTYAELAAALPRSGGVFAYILDAFGPLPAFLFGWSTLAVDSRLGARGHLDHLRGVPRLLRPADPVAGPVRGGGGHHPGGAVQLLRRERRGRPGQSLDRGQVRGAGGAGGAGLHHRPGDHRELRPGVGRGRPARRHGDGPHLDHVDLRRLGRPGLPRRRSEGPRQEPSARAAAGDRGHHRHLPRGEPGLPLPGAVARDGGFRPDRRHRRRADPVRSGAGRAASSPAW